jgi:hypothetical protein
MAYQIAFDLEEIATQDFLSKVTSNLPVPAYEDGTNKVSMLLIG